jgi:hypothetical protein
MDQTSNGWNDKRPEDLIRRAEQLLNNAQAHPEMTRAMAAYGYDQERWDTAAHRSRRLRTCFLNVILSEEFP